VSERPPEDTAGGELPPTLAQTGEGAEPPMDGDLVGRVLGGRYRILRKLGEGAMGAVYLGEHLKIGRQDAIKVLRDSLATDPDTIARFVRGTRNVSMIRHPNICTIYDYSDIAGGIQFVAMEFVPGETLRDLLQREGKLPAEVAVHIARQAAEALDAAHDVGIVHRDLKPANIMVVQGRGGTLEVKVVDFDIAKGSSDGEGEEVTRMGFVVGTPEYMSPEQLIGDRLDGRSDTYSLALVLYRMLTGTLPFTAEDTQDLMVKRLTEEPMTLAAGLPTGDFPLALEAAIRRALQRKPAERQPTAGEFGREISAAIEQPGTVASVGSRAAPGGSSLPPPRPRSNARDWPMPSKIAAAVAALAMVSVVAFVLLRNDPEPPLASADPALTAQAPIIEYSDPVAAPDTGEAVGEAEGEASPTNPSAEIPPASGPVEPPTRTLPPSEDDFLSMLVRLSEPYPARTMLMGVRDTAVAAWDSPAAAPRHRALAAFVAGSALISLGDTVSAVTWLQRAVDLRPDYQPYRTDLELYRELLSDY
jgi:serine/threonine protein kinase